MLSFKKFAPHSCHFFKYSINLILPLDKDILGIIRFKLI